MKTSHYLTQINKKQTGCKMEIIQEKVNDVAIVEIKGRLDVTTASDLEQVFTKLLSENQNKVLVECRELEYISSAGLRVLLNAAKQYNKVSGQIMLAGLSQNVKQVFEISGFTSIFPIYATRDEALKAF
jgi:anti-anti-sigma factor